MSIEQFTEVSNAFLSIVTIFGLGWGAHAFFHRKAHDDLKAEVASLKADLKEAKESQKVTVKIQNLTPQAVEQLQLSEDEIVLLQHIHAEGVFGPPERLSTARARLAGERLSEKGMTDDDEHGMFLTRLGLEWLDHHKLLD